MERPLKLWVSVLEGLGLGLVGSHDELVEATFGDDDYTLPRGSNLFATFLTDIEGLH